MDRAAFVDPFEDNTTSSAKPAFVDPFEDGDQEKKADEKRPLSWSDVPLEAAKSFFPDVYEQAKGIGGAAWGAVKAAAPYAKYGPLAPAKMASDIGGALYNDPSLATKIPKAVWNDLVDSYGSEEALKDTMAHHPAKFAMDLASVIMPVEGAVSKVGEIGRAADVSRPFFEGLPREPITRTPPPIPAELTPAQEALQRRQAAGQQVDIPRAVTSASPTVQAGGQALSVMPIVGTPLRQAVQAVPGQVGKHVEDIAAQFSPKMPENVVGGGIEQSLSGAAEREATEAQAAAEADLAKRRAAWEQENQAREQAITDRQAQATSAAERTFGNVNPMEMAQDTINDVQSAHRQARTRKDQLYDVVNNLDARVSTDAFSNLRDRAEQALVDSGVDIDDPGSNAAKMLNELDRLSGRPGEPAAIPEGVKPRVLDALKKTYGDNIPPEAWKSVGVEPPAPATEAIPPDFRLTGANAPAPGANAISVQGLEQLSKRIGRMGMNAVEPDDRNASRIVKQAFDDWRNDALGSYLTEDSAANARPAIDAARAAHRDLMQRFGYNYRRLPEGEPRNAAKALNQIVTGGMGPEGLRDNLIGAKPGNRRVSAPLYEAISNAVPNAGEFRNRMRGAYWNNISGGSPKSIASDIEGLTPTRMGSHLFEPHEHDLMRGFSQLTQDTPAQLKEAARIARENEPKLIKPEVGRAQQTAKDVLGRNRSDEQVLTKLDRAMREGGDIKTFARAWGQMSDANRNELRGTWLRNMGGGGEHFNVSAFVKNWNEYTDQAKTVMLGREHRAALDDFHTALKDYADTIKKYGNPSGTAQVTAWHKLAAGTLKGVGKLALATGPAALIHPIGPLVGGLGLRKIAKILATPQGAQQVNRWTRLAKAYDRAPSRNTLNLLQTATRSLETQSQ